MRTTISLGIALLFIGVILVAASSGAFDQTTADRSVGVESAGDEDALVGINDTETALTASDGEFVCTGNSSFWFFQYCSEGHFSYTESILVVLDQTPSTELEEVTVNDISSSSPNPVINPTDVRPENDDFLVEAEIQCSAECTGGSLVNDACQSPFGSGMAEQVPDTQLATVELEASGETIAVDLARTADIECKSGAIDEPE